MQHVQDQYDVGVIVGRFQTPSLHQGHRDLIDHVCAAHAKVIIFLGVSPLWATKQNPLDFQSRAQMIRELYPEVIVQYIDDMSSDKLWSQKLDKQVGQLVTPAQSVVLYGSRDSFIAHYLGNRRTQELESAQVFSATAERKLIAAGNTRTTEDFRAGVIWATQTRYASVMPTVDVAIFWDNTLQEIVLGRKPNEELLRFVGGFVDPGKDGSLEDAARREASEETGLEVHGLDYIGSHRVDDWRYRAEPDKIITTLFAGVRLWGHAVASDDLEEVRRVSVKDIDRDINQIVPEHRALWMALMNHLVILEASA